MSYSVELTEALLDDLFDLHRWIASQADEMVADGYLDRIHARMALLAEFPNRGTPRDELAPGVRSLAFERRILLLYTVEGSSVVMLRAIGGAQDLASAYEG